MTEPRMRGYFAVGAEGISKPVNLATLLRTAHAFGASFVFLIDAYYKVREGFADTSRAETQLPLFDLPSVDELRLPRGCKLVGVELVDAAIPLPSFGHPSSAAYVFGPERGSLSPTLQARCDWIVHVPMRFCVNLAVAAAIVLYDRLLSHGRFAPRPVGAGAPVEPPPRHVHGLPVLRTPSLTELERFRAGCRADGAKP